VVVQLDRPPVDIPDAAPMRSSTASARAWWLVLALAVVLGAGAAWVLRGSPFPPGGVGGDEGFRVASVAHDATSWWPTDFAYRGLPVFYPPLYFFALGRLAALTGVPAYEALKIGTIATAFLVPLVGFGLWRRLTGDAVLAGAVVVAGLALHDWYEPYAWLATVAFIPWWFSFVVRVRRDDRPLDTRRVVLGSAIGAAVMLAYYYPFFVGAVQLVALLAVSAILRRRGVDCGLRITRESWCVLAGTALVSAVFWAPLAVQALASGTFDSLQNRYFDAWMIAVPLPFLDFTLEGVVMACGLVALVVGCRRSRLLLGLLTLLVAAYAWWVLGSVAVLVDTPVLAARAVLLIEAILLAGAGIGVVEGFRAWRAVRPTPVIGALAVIAVTVLVVSALGAMPLLAEQRAAREPTAALRAFDRATAGGGKGDVVLVGAAPFASYRPVDLFNVWNAHYSNPTAEFTSRSRFIARLSTEPDPAVFAAALYANRYDRVRVVVLDASHDQLSYTDYQDNFPRGTRRRTLAFTREQFADRWFRASSGGGYALFVTRSGNPVAALDAAQRRALRAHFPGDLAVPN
jgi:hypothetical protein